ncbi:MAG: hypothetical protein P9M15_05195, partial [Candidatus Electryoneaceae bacterium]|nr:hypothetical protein [Candidatus Electryoneaceae bacterium]
MNNQSIRGVEKVLRDKPNVITRAIFWDIPHDSPKEDVRLKIGRYRKKRVLNGIKIEEPESLTPKSELTLDHEEFQNLIAFLQEEYEPFKAGVKAFIPLDQPLDSDLAETLRGFFNHPEKHDLLDFILQHH